MFMLREVAVAFRTTQDSPGLGSGHRRGRALFSSMRDCRLTAHYVHENPIMLDGSQSIILAALHGLTRLSSTGRTFCHC